MSNSQTKNKIIAVFAVVFISYVGYYGTYLPVRKSHAFILAMQSIRSAEAIPDLQRILSEPLKMKSPVGHEELVRNTANVFLNILSTVGDPAIIAQIVDFVEENYKPIIERGTGMSFGQNLYILGAINETAFIKTNQMKYLDSAEKYYSRGLELGPNRPQPLYGLFDVYRIRGDKVKSKEILDKILGQWPNDERVKQGYAEFLEKVVEFEAKQK